MRTIVLIFILINLAFFYWARESSFDEGVLDHPRSISGYEPIKMLSELEHQNSGVENNNDQAANTTAQSSAGVSQLAIIQKCFSLGPFADAGESNKAYESLFALGIPAKQRVVQERQPKSYWVYIPPYPSLEAAKEAVEYLKDNKVREYYIWLDDPLKNAVSLGLFTNLKTARSKVAQIKKLNLNPEMEVRFNEITEHWVDFKRNPESSRPEILEGMLRNNDRLLILETKCL